ncbi:major facilitator superfamily domain-containing protein [Podospora aff. communis PSN243]|uniref:Major facilitator superfamily domain-containing protein n=1 Tax=Podospora aff. communis PSN243 TaxID=3040156 RepID=A0AAV9GPP0_9PEZI|nr:major facilitator superfamily domain-containing protein [Podospora aff. communis PSN243]
MSSQLPTRSMSAPGPSRQHHDSLAVALELKSVDLRHLSRGSRVSHPYPSELEEAAIGQEMDEIDIGPPALPPPDQHEYLTGARLAVVSAATTIVVLLTMIDTSIVSTAIPRITDEFHSLDDIGWYASIYQLASAALQPLTGKIYTKFNIKWSFLVFFAIFELGSALCGMSRNSLTFIVGRAVAGAGSSGLMNGALTIAANIVSMERRASVTGLMMGTSQLGVVIGPLVGGVLTSYSTWRWCFYLNLPVGAVVFMALLFIRIPEQVKKKKPMDVLKNLHQELDLLGFILFTPAMMMLLLALQYGGTRFPWDSRTITGMFVGSGLLFSAWLVWDWMCGDEALIPFSLMRKRTVWSGSLTQWCNMTIVFSAGYFLPLFFQAVKGATPVMSGVYVLPSVLSQLVFAGMSGFLVEKVGYVIPFTVFSGTVAAVSNGLYSTFSLDTPVATWIGYQVLNGIGRGTGMSMPLVAAQAALTPAEISMVMGILVFFGMLGAAIMMALANTIFNQSLRVELTRGFHSATVAQTVIEAGATGFRRVVSQADMRMVINAYSASISRVFYLIAAAGATSVFTSLFMGRRGEAGRRRAM